MPAVSPSKRMQTFGKLIEGPDRRNDEQLDRLPSLPVTSIKDFRIEGRQVLGFSRGADDPHL